MKYWFLSAICGVAAITLFLYYDYRLGLAYERLGEMGGLVELSRFGSVSELAFNVLLILNLAFSFLSLIRTQKSIRGNRITSVRNHSSIAFVATCY